MRWVVDNICPAILHFYLLLGAVLSQTERPMRLQRRTIHPLLDGDPIAYIGAEKQQSKHTHTMHLVHFPYLTIPSWVFKACEQA